jgi:hypothetical protein
MKILVDSKEVSSASQTISTLRLSEQIDPIVVSLCHCDYIVSNRMGVKRVHQSSKALTDLMVFCFLTVPLL